MFDFEALRLQKVANRILQSGPQRLLFFQGVTRQVRESNHGCFNNDDGCEGEGRLLIASPTSTQACLQPTLRGLRVGLRCSQLSKLTLHYFSGWHFNPGHPDAFTAEVPGLFLSLDPRDYPNQPFRNDDEFFLVSDKNPAALPMVLGSVWSLVQLFLDDPDTFASVASSAT